MVIVPLFIFYYFFSTSVILSIMYFETVEDESLSEKKEILRSSGWRYCLRQIGFTVLKALLFSMFLFPIFLGKTMWKYNRMLGGRSEKFRIYGFDFDTTKINT